MKSHHSTDLSSQIEQLIHDHMAAYRRAAQDAVARAFEGATTLGTAATKKPAVPRSAAAAGGRSRRRTRAEIREMSEQFYHAVLADPGETMASLADKLGLSARDLHRPMDLLRQAKRIRTAGARHFTRYFPMCERDALAA